MRSMFRLIFFFFLVYGCPMTLAFFVEKDYSSSSELLTYLCQKLVEHICGDISGFYIVFSWSVHLDLLQHHFLNKYMYVLYVYSSVQFSRSVVSDSLQPHGLQHARPPCPSPTPRAYSNTCPLTRWCHPTISSSVVPFSPCLQSFPASGSFHMSQFFTWGGQSIGVSASALVLPMNVQDWWSDCSYFVLATLQPVSFHYVVEYICLWLSKISLWFW